jgi:hypothetical protein
MPDIRPDSWRATEKPDRYAGYKAGQLAGNGKISEYRREVLELADNSLLLSF